MISSAPGQNLRSRKTILAYCGKPCCGNLVVKPAAAKLAVETLCGKAAVADPVVETLLFQAVESLLWQAYCSKPCCGNLVVKPAAANPAVETLCGKAAVASLPSTSDVVTLLWQPCCGIPPMGRGQGDAVSAMR